MIKKLSSVLPTELTEQILLLLNDNCYIYILYDHVIFRGVMHRHGEILQNLFYNKFHNVFIIIYKNMKIYNEKIIKMYNEKKYKMYNKKI